MIDIQQRVAAEAARQHLPEGVSVAVPNDATPTDVVRKLSQDYPARTFTGKVLHVSDPDEIGPGLTEYVFEVKS